MVPAIDLREGKLLPIIGALYHPPGGVIRHDAVVWGFARGANRLGASLHPFTEATGIRRENGVVTGVETSSGFVRTGTVVNATAGWTSTIVQTVGLELPITTHPLQALVTEPLKPFLDKTVSSANLHAYVYQTDRGEVVIGGGVEPLPDLQPEVVLRGPGGPSAAYGGDVSLPYKRESAAPVDGAV